MTASSFALALPFVLQWEGRCYTDDPRDPGSATNWGITLGAYQTWSGNHCATTANLRSLTPVVITAFYADLWRKSGGNDLPGGVDLSVFDGMVNTGKNSIRQLQRVVGAACDGLMGPKTLAAVEQTDAQALVLRLKPASLKLLQGALGMRETGVLDAALHTAVAGQMPAVLSCALWDQHWAYYRMLADFPTYGDGWLSRALDRAGEALKLTMAGI